MYLPERTWLMQGPRPCGLGDLSTQNTLVPVAFPLMANDPQTTFVLNGSSIVEVPGDTGTPVSLQFPMSGPSGGSSNPFGFVDGSQPVTILQPSGAGGAVSLPGVAAAIGSPCFQVGFPWFGLKTALGTCKPLIDVGPVVGVMVTALLVGAFFFKGVRR